MSTAKSPPCAEQGILKVRRVSTTDTAVAAIVPDHVPPDLVRHDFPFSFGAITESDPFRDLADGVHKGPEIFYAPRAYPGGSGAWIVRRTKDLRQIYMDPATYSSTNFSVFARIIGASWINSPVELDPPEHGPFRAMLNPCFTPRAMSALEDKIRAYAAGYVESFAAAGQCEFMSQMAFELPIRVFMELAGLPQERVGEFLRWEQALLFSPTLEGKAQAARTVTDYLAEEIEAHRVNPRDDLISFALSATKEGKPLTDDEVMGFCFNLFIGGLDTVSTHMGHQFRHLAQHPDDQAVLRADPALIPQAVDEFMRAYGAVNTFRTCTRDVIFNGIQFRKGDKVLTSTTLSGRDPEEFEAPWQVRFDRKPRHTGFGYGIHTCIGMHLARLEMKIALEEFLRRIPEFHLKPGHRLKYRLGMVQPIELPLEWTPN